MNISSGLWRYEQINDIVDTVTILMRSIPTSISIGAQFLRCRFQNGDKPMKFKVAIVYRSFSDDSGRSEEATEPFRYFNEDIDSRLW